MFSKLGLSSPACASLARLGYETPTPIQTEAIPLVLTGVDLLARAQTGTGKTAAFGLPMIERLLTAGATTSRVTPRALVLVPTRELAVQVHQALSAYAAPTRLRLVTIYGGVGMGAQVQALRRGADIVVATPGRLIDHLRRKTVDLSAVEVLTLDEADRMLDMGFLPALRTVAATLPRTRQTLLFSATLPEAVIRLSAEFTRNAVRVNASAEQVVPVTVTHQVHHVTVERKRDVLTHILTQDGAAQALVFCKTKRGANRVGEDLGQRGVRTGIIHGNKSQNARSRALDDFKSGRVRVLVASTSSTCRWSSTSTCRSCPRTTCIVWVGPGAPDSADAPFHWSRHRKQDSCARFSRWWRRRSSASRLPSSRRTHTGRSSTCRRGRMTLIDPGRRAVRRTGAAISGSTPAGASALAARSAPADRQQRKRPSRDMRGS